MHGISQAALFAELPPLIAMLKSILLVEVGWLGPHTPVRARWVRTHPTPP